MESNLPGCSPKFGEQQVPTGRRHPARMSREMDLDEEMVG